MLGSAREDGKGRLSARGVHGRRHKPTVLALKQAKLPARLIGHSVGFSGDGGPSPRRGTSGGCGSACRFVGFAVSLSALCFRRRGGSGRPDPDFVGRHVNTIAGSIGRRWASAGSNPTGERSTADPS